MTKKRFNGKAKDLRGNFVNSDYNIFNPCE